ncbi:MAG: hypothetical protein CL927_06735 [Deltaproteobacteria bacterium]|nr:hypothetical protein [Deltaproteobacteria bacterium]
MTGGYAIVQSPTNAGQRNALMAQIGDFFARLVSAGGTRGLSGDADRVLPSEPVFAFFNDRLRKHHTAEDFVASPSLLWATQTFLSRRGGLEAHLRAERGDGVAGFSDILVVINRHDWRRSLRLLAEPWAAAAAHRLRTQFQQYCEAQDFHRLFPQRPMGVRIVQDGGLEMGGESLGLGRGEFVTGLLPNFYAGAHATSRPVVAFHLNIPGEWTGYREVGRLYSDQVLFTLGSHWLENFQHPRLQLPALYRLQQFSDGSFIHVVNPEAIGDVLIKEHESNGATVLTLQHVSGVALAHLVLAMLDESSMPVVPGAGGWTGASISGEPKKDEQAEQDDQEHPNTDRAAPVVPDTFHQSRTVVPAEVGARLLTLRERGVLLQRVHFARFMSGYDVFIGPRGEIGTALEAPSATLQVRRRSVAVVAHVPEVHLDTGPLVPGRPTRLSGSAVLRVGGTQLELVDLSAVDIPQWPYLLEIRRRGNSSHLVFGRNHKMGRDPRCSVRLPDEPHNGNIIWHPEVESSQSIRSRNGEIPKSRFYIDSIMVASEHAELDLTDTPLLRGRARDCFTFVRRADEVLTITPQRTTTGRREVLLQPQDELLIGNCVFQIGWSDGDDGPEDHEREMLTADLLASVVDEIQTEDPAAGGDDLPSLSKPSSAPSQPGSTSILEPPQTTEPSSASQTDDPPSTRPAAPPMMMRTEPPPPESTTPTRPLPTPAPPMMLHTEPPQEASTCPPLEHISEPSHPTLSDLVEAPSVPVKLRLANQLDPLHTEALPTVNALDVEAPAPAEVPPEPALLEATPPATPTLAEFDLGPSATHSTGESDAKTGPAPPSSPHVVIVDESDWQLELGRPARLVTTGWMVAGRVTVGNHTQCDVVLPENRSSRSQTFSPTTLARIKVRGARGHAELVSPDHASLHQGTEPTVRADSLDDMTLRVPRLDTDGDVDFTIELQLHAASDLPDPRAQLLRWNPDESMAAGLFTTGLPLSTPRSVRLGPVSARVLWDGTALQVSHYLESYRTGHDAYQPFFVRHPGGRFQTVPEDGRPLSLAPGATLICGMAWIDFEASTS